jgi:hypothetical protein
MRYEEIWAADPGHAYYPPRFEYAVHIMHKDETESEVTVMMMSNDEDRSRIKRVVALHNGWDESEFRVTAFYRSFGEVEDADEDDDESEDSDEVDLESLYHKKTYPGQE